MKKVIIIAFSAISLFAIPSQYQVKKMPAGSPAPAIDGSISEWSEEYFVDSLQGDTNVYYRTTTTPWTRDQFQMKLYMTYDDSKVYFAVQVIQDDENSVCGTQGLWSGGCDNMKPNPGGKGASFYIWANGTYRISASCPYVVNSTLWIGGNGTGAFPVYEFAIRRDALDTIAAGYFTFSVATEDVDPNQGEGCFAGIGGEYIGEWKLDCPSISCGTYYYPTFTLSTDEGPAIGVENAQKPVKGGITLSASPNPFMPSTMLSYTSLNRGSLKIFDLSGKIVKNVAVKKGTGRVKWDAKEMASGIYFAHLTSGKEVMNIRLFLVR